MGDLSTWLSRAGERLGDLALGDGGPEPGPKERRGLGGAYLETPLGTTHYEIRGPEDGPPLVLVHGAMIPMWVWDWMVPRLRRTGYRVIRYDHLGRGLSDRPRGVYNTRLHVDHLEQVLDGLGLNRPVYLAGLSLGGAISVEFTVRHPERVEKLALVAPVVNGVSGNPAFRLLQPPVLGELILRFLGPALTRRRAARLAPDPAQAARCMDLYLEQTRLAGFQRSFLSLLRNDALGDHRPAFAKLGRLDTPVMAIRGDADPEITAADLEDIRRLVPRAEIHLLPGVGHGSPLEAPEEVCRLLEEFRPR